MQTKNKTIIFCAAGTGGHLFPAQQLALELQREYNILFAGKNLSHNPYFDQKNFPFLEINAATLSFTKPWRLVKEVYAITQGLVQSITLLQEQKPALVVGFGSFFSLPLLLAAQRQKVPIILHEQNLLPGRVNRLFSSRALFLATTFAESCSYVKGPVRQVPFPQRLSQEGLNRREVALYFGLEEDKKTLLIFGGSQGAVFLNQLMETVATVLQKEEWQILHFIGKGADIARFRSHYERYGIKAAVKNFESQMHKAYFFADVALCRAGAATLSELLQFDLPACLIPFPLATEDHQTKNAEFFVNVVQGGWLLPQHEVTIAKIKEILFSSDAEVVFAKKQKIKEYKQQESHLQSLSSLIKEHLL